MSLAVSLYIADDFMRALCEIYDFCGNDSLVDGIRSLLETQVRDADPPLICNAIAERYDMGDTVMCDIREISSRVTRPYRLQMDLKARLCLELEYAPPNMVLKVGGVRYQEGLQSFRDFCLMRP